MEKSNEASVLCPPWGFLVVMLHCGSAVGNGSDLPRGCMRGSGGVEERAACWKSEPRGHSTKEWAGLPRSDLLFRVLEHFHGLFHLPFLVALLQQAVTGAQVAQELQKKTTGVNPTLQTQGATAFRSPPCNLPGHTHGEDLGHHHPACVALSAGLPRGEDNISVHPLSQGGSRREDEGQTKHLIHLRYKATASGCRVKQNLSL